MAIAYRGRFAPSPTGPLHFGSLVAALGSYLEARTQGGEWLLRIEDVDAPRSIPGASEAIIRSLDDFGFEWDGDILWQSERLDAYAAALEQLKEGALVYGCACTRREIGDSATRTAIDGALVYPGNCRNGLPAGLAARAWRLRTPSDPIGFTDGVQGYCQQQLESDVGDFVLHRADGQFAYQLAVVVDDAAQGITHIVRGADLLDSTPRQIWLQHCLALPTPHYAHLPVACTAGGEKLSKQTLAPALRADQAAASLFQALMFLGQEPPAELAAAPLPEVWVWARSHWRFSRIPRTRCVTLENQSLSSTSGCQGVGS